MRNVTILSKLPSVEGIPTAAGRALITSKAVFIFDPARRRFAPKSVDGGATGEDVRALAGFDYDEPADPRQTPSPSAEALALITGRVTDEVAETYPWFAAALPADRAG